MEPRRCVALYKKIAADHPQCYRSAGACTRRRLVSCVVADDGVGSAFWKFAGIPAAGADAGIGRPI